MIAGNPALRQGQERIAFGGQDGLHVRSEGFPPVGFSHTSSLHPHPQHGVGEGDVDVCPVPHALRAGCHVVDGEGPARPVGDVGRGVVHGLTVVEHGAARRQVDHRRPFRCGLVAQVEEGTGLGRPFMGRPGAGVIRESGAWRRSTRPRRPG